MVTKDLQMKQQNHFSKDWEALLNAEGTIKTVLIKQVLKTSLEGGVGKLWSEDKEICKKVDFLETNPSYRLTETKRVTEMITPLYMY